MLHQIKTEQHVWLVNAATYPDALALVDRLEDVQAGQAEPNPKDEYAIAHVYERDNPRIITRRCLQDIAKHLRYNSNQPEAWEIVAMWKKKHGVTYQTQYFQYLTFVNSVLEPT